MRHPETDRNGGESSALYFERQWVPWWVLAAIFAGFFTFVYALFLFFGLTGKAAPPLDSHVAQLVPAAATGLFGVLVTWVSHVFRTISVDGTKLTVSGMSRLSTSSVQLNDVSAVAIARGSEVRDLRNDMGLALSPGGLLIPLGGEIGAVGTAAVGVPALGSVSYARAMLASFWMHEAVVVYAPEDLTPLWLIGTRHPEELAAAIRQGAELPDSDP